MSDMAVTVEYTGRVEPVEAADRVPYPLQTKEVEISGIIDNIQTDELLCKILMATICGSDLHTLGGHRPKEPYPGILGHEAVVQVEVSRREGFVAGDRLTFHIADVCGQCDPCKYGLQQKCTKLFKYGHAKSTSGTGLNGCYASHIVIRGGTHVVKIPEEIPDKVAAPINCALATMVCALADLKTLLGKFPPRKALVQGAGMLGLYACALLREEGFETVHCADINIDRLALVTKFGGVPINATDDSVEDGTYDLVVEVCGVKQVFNAGIKALRFGGCYVLVGLVHPNSALDITGEKIIRKCMTIKGVHNYGPDHLTGAVNFLGATQAKYPYEQLVSDPVPLRELQDAITTSYSQEYLRVSVTP